MPKDQGNSNLIVDPSKKHWVPMLGGRNDKFMYVVTVDWLYVRVLVKWDVLELGIGQAGFNIQVNTGIN